MTLMRLSVAPLALLSASVIPSTAAFAPHIGFGTARRSRAASGLLMSTSPANATNLSTATVEGPPLPPVAPTAKRLFLVRHGEVINPGGDRPVYYGAMDVSLSPLGELEAQAAARYLNQFDLQHIACSPLTRAIYGAEQVKKLQKIEKTDLLLFEGFKELDRGAWCGLTKLEIGDDMMARFDACDQRVTPEGGESYPTLKKRVLLARDELLQQTDPGQAAALVSHLQVTRCFISDALDIPTEAMATLKVATASVTCIDYDSSAGTQTVHFKSFKPEAGLQKSADGAN